MKSYPKIFLSYAKEDRAIVEEIFEFLKQNGCDPWMDVKKLEPGQKWEYEINRAIREADFFVSCLSEKSVNKIGYIHAELKKALKRFRKYPEGKVFLIPIRLDNCQVPDALLDWQWLDWFNTKSRNQLLTGIKHAFNSSNSNSDNTPTDTGQNEITDIIRDILQPSDYSLYIACEVISDKSKDQELVSRWKKIFESQICVFDISEINPSVFIELGIALSLYKTTIIIAKIGTPIPEILKVENRILMYEDLSDLREKLTLAKNRENLHESSAVTNKCHFCDRYCPYESPEPNPKRFLILDHRKPFLLQSLLLSRIGLVITDERQVYPEYLIKIKEIPLCEFRRKVLENQFVIFDTGAPVDPKRLIAMGLAVGNLVPWVVLHHKSGRIPEILNGTYSIHYDSLYETNNESLANLNDILNVILPWTVKSQPSIKKLTAQSRSEFASNPPWSELASWKRQKSDVAAGEAILTTIRILQIHQDDILNKYYIHPVLGLRFGRDKAICDVELENEFVSREHFLIIQEEDENYYIHDLESDNGTYVNGRRIYKRQRLFFRDEIRIAGSHFLIWDGRSLPAKPGDRIPTDPASSNTRVLQTKADIVISFDDIPPPSHFGTWDHRIILQVKLPFPYNNQIKTVSIQSYYPMGIVLEELQKELKLPGKEYYWVFNNEKIGGELTPSDLNLITNAEVSISESENTRREREAEEKLKEAIKSTYEQIQYCGQHCQRQDENGKWIWVNGKKLGTLREVFALTYSNLHHRELPQNAKIPPIQCPTCKKTMIDEDMVIGGFTSYDETR